MKLCIFDLDDTLYDTSNRLDEITPNFATMKLFPDAQKILESTTIPKVLVTYGNKDLQEKKIQTLDIRKYFGEIFISEDRGEKKDFFRKIIEKYGIEDHKQVVVVGDRIDTEIRFGNMLGCTTVHLQRGKYMKLKPSDRMDVPSHVITSLTDLVPILAL